MIHIRGHYRPVHHATRSAESKDPFTPSGSELESEKDQRKKFEHQRKFSLLLSVKGP